MRGFGPILLLLVACELARPTPTPVAVADAGRPDAAPADAGRSDAAAPGDAGPLTEELDPDLDEVIALMPDLARELRVIRPRPPHAFRVEPIGRRALLDMAEVLGDDSLAERQALAHLGFLASPADSVFATRAILETQGGAIDPRTGTILVAYGNRVRLFLPSLLIHAQQQATRPGYLDDPRLSTDEVSARAVLAMGEQTVVYAAFLIRQETGANALNSLNISIFRKLVWRLAQTQALYRHILSLRLPLLILESLRVSATIGPVLALDAYVQNGWARLDDLFRNPPESTEQVLHYQVKLLSERDHPVRLTLPEPGAPWRPLAPPDTLGELSWQVYFVVQRIARSAEAAAAGWDGDRVAVWTDGTRTFAFVATAWDTPEDAAAFAAAYRRSLPNRRREVEVMEQGQLVLIVNGCDRARCPELVEKLLAGVKVEGTPGPE